MVGLLLLCALLTSEAGAVEVTTALTDPAPPDSRVLTTFVETTIESARATSGRARFDSSLVLLDGGLAVLDSSGNSVSRLRADLLHEKGIALMNLRRWEAAGPCLAEALRIRTRELGDRDPAVAASLLHRGIFRAMTASREDPQPDYDTALEILAAARGERHPEYLWALNARASFLQGRGRLDEAAADYAQVISVRTANGQGSDVSLAWTLQNLAILNHRLDRFAAAESLYTRACAIRQDALGDDPLTARSLTGLGSMRFLRGDFPGGRDALERAMRIFDARGIREDDDVASCMLQLGRYRAWTGEFSSACELFDRAEGIMAARGHVREQVDCLSQRARCRLAEGRPEEAAQDGRRALALADSAFGPETAEAGSARLLLSAALGAAGRAEGADREFHLGLDIVERATGPESHALGWAWYDRGSELLRRREYAGAGRAFGRSLAILEADLGETHPQLMRCRLGLAESWYGQGNVQAACEGALKAHDLELRHVAGNIRYMTEYHALLYRDVLASSSDFLLALLAGHPALRPVYAARIWGAVSSGRGLITDEVIRRHARAAGEAPGPATNALAAARARLANLYVQGAESRPNGDYERRLRSALRETEALEQSSRRTATDAPTARLRVEAVLDRLPADTALLSFVRFSTALPGADNPRSRYGAFVGDHRRRIRFVPLESAEGIDEAVLAWGRHMDEAGTLLRADPVTALARHAELGGRLRERIWDPVAPDLAEYRRVLVVPEATLQVVALPVLPLPGGRFVQDLDLRLCGITAERDLLRPHLAAGRGILALGDPDFDLQETAWSPAATFARADIDMPRGGSIPVPGDFQRITYSRLPGTAIESRGVVDLLRTCRGEPGEVLTGPEAAESAFKARAPGHRILHLATHGYFLDGAGDPAPEAARWAGLRSGLILAGGNRRAVAGPGEEDGVLTAEEVADVNLAGVDLAVLSACSSGRGTPTRSEGVFGLRRAFQVAGVRALVMSLWPVGDTTTQAWMKEFYGSLCGSGGVSAAADAASRAILQQRRAAGESTHPFYWGSFAATGDTE